MLLSMYLLFLSMMFSYEDKYMQAVTYDTFHVA